MKAINISTSQKYHILYIDMHFRVEGNLVLCCCSIDIDVFTFLRQPQNNKTCLNMIITIHYYNFTPVVAFGH